MGGFTTSTDTEFVGTDELGAVSSFQPCHLFGNPMLIGLGIRLAFYQLYAAAILAVLFGVNRQFRYWHGSWTVVALATFIALCLNSTGNTLIIIDWAVLIQLVLWYPVFFIFLLLNRRVLGISRGSREVSPQELWTRLQPAATGGRTTTGQDIARARAYANFLKAFAQHATANETSGGLRKARSNLAEALHGFVALWHGHDTVELVDGPHRSTQDIELDPGIIAAYYQPLTISEIAAIPTAADVYALRDNFVAALVHAESLSLEDARAAERVAARVAVGELQFKSRQVSLRSAVHVLMRATPAKDKLVAALGLFVFAAYMLVTPWLYSAGLDHGRKAECDASVKLLFALAPLSPFVGSGFKTFLLVFASGGVIVALFVSLAAVAIITIGLFGRRGRKWKAGRRGHDEQTGHKKNENAALSMPNGGDDDDDDEYSPIARQRHAEEILVALQSMGGVDGHAWYRRHFMTGRPVQFSKATLPWALLLLILLLETIVTVEEMVKLDQLDFVLPPMHGTAEILSFLVGALALVLVIWSVVSGLVVARSLKRRREKAGDEEQGRKKMALS